MFLRYLTFIFCAIPISTFAQHNYTPETDKISPEIFKNPPLQAKPKALWPWVNGNFSYSQITYEMEQAKEKGMAGFDIWDVGVLVDNHKILPAGPSFLGEESLQGIAFAVKEAERLGLELGLITSSSWNAGGSWIKPEHAAIGLYNSDTTISGGKSFKGKLKFPGVPKDSRGSRYDLVPKNPETGLPSYYKDIATLAYQTSENGQIEKVLDISHLMKEDGSLKWRSPRGKWHITRYVCFPTGQQLAIASPNARGFVLDHFSEAAQEFNMNYILSKLKSTLGSLRNRSLKYLYEDSYEVNSGVWTPLLAEKFQEKYGYSLLTYLPLIQGLKYKNETSSKKILHDFNKLLSNLIIKNHYEKGRLMAEAEGLGFYAEAGGPGQPIHNVPFEDLKALGSLTVPRGEFWNKHNSLEALQIVKGISSASHIYNQKFVEAEAFTSVWLWQEGPHELKPLADRAMCEGLNRFVYHTFAHSPPEGGVLGWIYNFGTIINTTNGWWPKSQGFHEYLGRSSYLLQQGNFVGDVAFYYGDQAPNFVKPKHIPEGLGAGYDYDVVNTETILNSFSVKNGKLYLPHGQHYEVLILPEERLINPEVLKKIEKLVEAGATVIGAKPLSGYSRNADNEKIKVLANKIWGATDGIQIKENRFGLGKVVWGKSIREVLQENKVMEDVKAELENADDSAIDYIHRSTLAHETYFLRNKQSSPINGTVTFRVKNKLPEFWNAETGEIYPINSFKEEKSGIRIPLSLEALGSCFIVFKDSEQKVIEVKVDQNNSGVVFTKNGISVISSTKSSLMTIDSPWKVSFEKRTNSPLSITMDSLQSLHLSDNDGVKNFSGQATYQNSFEVKREQLDQDFAILLKLNKVREIADVYLNGEKLGTHWHDNHFFDISDKVKLGKNSLVIEVVNSINNRLVGDAKLPEDFRQMRSNIAKLPNAWNTDFAEAPLIPAGLMGPVQVQWVEYLK